MNAKFTHKIIVWQQKKIHQFDYIYQNIEDFRDDWDKHDYNDYIVHFNIVIDNLI